MRFHSNRPRKVHVQYHWWSHVGCTARWNGRTIYYAKGMIMSRAKSKTAFDNHWPVIFLAILLGVSGWAIGGCKIRPPEQAQNARRYPLVGQIVSVSKDQNTLVVDGEAIPGFMDAMTMPYPVRDAHMLDGLAPGDEITAVVVVDNNGATLENIAVTKKGGGTASEAVFHEPQPGDEVPNFTFIDENGRVIHLDSFHGHVLMVTFIYTRCPFATFCPLVSHHFADIYAATKKDPKLSSSVRLLTLSFDPTHDTPAVLRRYGESFRETTGGIPFDRWVFAAAPLKELPAVANFFGLTYSDHDGTIVHSLSTTVITPDGKVYKWYDHNDWQPADLVTQATQLLDKDRSTVTASHSHAAKTPGTAGN